MAGVKLGLLVTAIALLLGRFAPQPAGSVVLWSLIALHLAAGSAIVWHRLRLPWLRIGTTAMLPAALATVAAAAQGFDLRNLSQVYPAAVAIVIWTVLIAALPLSLAAEWRRDSSEWRAWVARTDHATLWEIITFRHVPDLQHRRGSTSAPTA